MPRIRTTKPDHWENERWDTVSLQSHLLYLAMKNFADDSGVTLANHTLIKNRAFPTREDILTALVSDWITELLSAGFLIRIEYETKAYYVMDFRGEKIDKPGPSILPKDAFFCNSENSREYSRMFGNVRAGEERRGEESSVKERRGEEAFTPPIFSVFFEFFKKNDFSEDLAKKAFSIYNGNGWLDTKGNVITDWEQKVIDVWFTDEERDKQKKKKNIGKFPDFYKPSLVALLAGPELSQYYAHLNGLGLVAKKDRFDHVIDFVRPQDLPATNRSPLITNNIGKGDGNGKA